jgi:Domain of unknown function (DUF4265)
MNSGKMADMVKVRFCDPRWPNIETLWATRIEEDLYQLDNSPFFAYGVSWQDVIEAKSGEDHVLEYVRCIKKSGNRTVRIIFQDRRSTDSGAEEVLRELRHLGCSFEGMQPRLISVNVPPEIGLSAVTDFLKKQTGLEWEYADPTYEQVTRCPN